ncbi:MAG: hypothetical protein LBK03_05740 [Bacteroidales bacterium]|jgi:hypothetical protein|nr:hypothetical protein [Bacteroidales bacterium]
MKRSIICILAIFLALSLPAQQGGECFYYYRGEKFFLTERTDKIFLKLAADGNKASFLSSIRAGNAVQLSPDLQEGDMLPNFVMLEAKTATGIPLALLEEYRLNSSVISALPLLQYDNRLQGLTDQFIVKLKAGTSDMQFQDLISQYNCSIVKESQFIKRQFIVSVPKTIAFNALQLSNLFYETGWFEFAEPNFVIINAFQSNDPYFEDQWGLKNTGQAGGTAGIDIKAEQAWLTATGAGV